MKKYIAAVTVAAVALGLAGCEKGAVNKPADGEASSVAQSEKETGDLETVEAETETETETEIETEEETFAQYDAASLDNTTYGWYYMSNENHAQPNGPNEHSIDFAKYNTFYMGNPDDKIIYLTFDEGYENGYTEQILDALKEKNVKAAFFITQYFIEQRPDLVKRMVEEGHIVGNHSVNHLSSPELSDEEFANEINELADYFKEVTGQEMPKYFRPPRGEYSERTLALANNMGWKSIFWSFAHRDWLVDDQPTVQATHDKVMSQYHNGEVMLLHAVSQSNADALGSIIDDLSAEGYKFGSLDELCAK